ncbi:MAG: flavin reductase [Crenarchaeota archaeon]|nr:flavin reductase [Thermoproteota archaeon]
MVEMKYLSLHPSQACYLLMPSIVTLIVTHRPDGGYNAMTACWIMPVSRSPPRIAVAISPRRFTYECLRSRPEFTVCVLGPEQEEIADYCGSVSGRDENKIEKLEKKGIKLRKLEKVSTPGIEGCPAIIGCKVWRDYEGGDHRIIVGEVVECIVKEDKFRDTWRDVDLLYYYGGARYLTVRVPS